MQTDQSIDSATATSRRAFLTRTAVGGALVTAGALALPLSSLTSGAGARPASQGELKDAEFVAFAAPLELAAVAAYTAAFDLDLLEPAWSAKALLFQSHHQDVADTLTTLGDDTAAAPVADAAFTTTSVNAVRAAKDQNAILLALAQVEETLAATHLAAVGVMAEKSTAKTVTQVLAVEGQQAALLAVGAGTAIAEVTPATNEGDAALTIPSEEELTAATSTTTSTTTAATGKDGSQTDQSDTGDADTQTSAPSAND